MSIPEGWRVQWFTVSSALNTSRAEADAAAVAREKRLPHAHVKTFEGADAVGVLALISQRNPSDRSREFVQKAIDKVQTEKAKVTALIVPNHPAGQGRPG